MPLIADGGMRYSGDLAKAIAAGADTVMMGGVFAGTEEAPGEVILYQGRTYKSYRGMGSIGAMQQGSADRYFQEGETPATPTAPSWCPRASRARCRTRARWWRSSSRWPAACAPSMHYCGCASIADMHDKAEFVEITTAGIRESHVHDVQITKEAPNYRAE